MDCPICGKLMTELGSTAYCSHCGKRMPRSEPRLYLGHCPKCYQGVKEVGGGVMCVKCGYKEKIEA